MSWTTRKAVATSNAATSWRPSAPNACALQRRSRASSAVVLPGSAARASQTPSSRPISTRFVAWYPPIRSYRRATCSASDGDPGCAMTINATSPAVTMASMRLTAWEEERLLIFAAAELARRHRDRGLLLNAPEAIALICDAMLEAARAGASYEDVEAAGSGGRDRRRGHARRARARPRGPARGAHGRRDAAGRARRPARAAAPTRPGAVRAGDPRRRPPPTTGASASSSTVRNTSRRVVRVSSHYPFERVNARLEFDRAAAAGFRLDLAGGLDRALGARRDADGRRSSVRRRGAGA